MNAINHQDGEWASNAIINVLCGCVVNIKLKELKICDKLICEMNSLEIEEYVKLLSNIDKKLVKNLISN